MDLIFIIGFIIWSLKSTSCDKAPSMRPYSFSYSVADPESGNFHGHVQKQDEDGRTSGSYYHLAPDGMWHETTFSDKGYGYTAGTRQMDPNNPLKGSSVSVYHYAGHEAESFNSGLIGKSILQSIRNEPQQVAVVNSPSKYEAKSPNSSNKPKSHSPPEVDDWIVNQDERHKSDEFNIEYENGQITSLEELEEREIGTMSLNIFANNEDLPDRSISAEYQYQQPIPISNLLHDSKVPVNDMAESLAPINSSDEFNTLLQNESHKVLPESSFPSWQLSKNADSYEYLSSLEEEPHQSEEDWSTPVFVDEKIQPFPEIVELKNSFSNLDSLNKNIRVLHSHEVSDLPNYFEPTSTVNQQNSSFEISAFSDELDIPEKSTYVVPETRQPISHEEYSFSRELSLQQANATTQEPQAKEFINISIENSTSNLESSAEMHSLSYLFSPLIIPRFTNQPNYEHKPENHVQSTMLFNDFSLIKVHNIEPNSTDLDLEVNDIKPNLPEANNQRFSKLKSPLVAEYVSDKSIPSFLDGYEEGSLGDVLLGLSNLGSVNPSTKQISENGFDDEYNSSAFENIAVFVKQDLLNLMDPPISNASGDFSEFSTEYDDEYEELESQYDDSLNHFPRTVSHHPIDYNEEIVTSKPIASMTLILQQPKTPILSNLTKITSVIQDKNKSGITNVTPTKMVTNEVGENLNQDFETSTPNPTENNIPYNNSAEANNTIKETNHFDRETWRKEDQNIKISKIEEEPVTDNLRTNSPEMSQFQNKNNFKVFIEKSNFDVDQLQRELLKVSNVHSALQNNLGEQQSINFLLPQIFEGNNAVLPSNNNTLPMIMEDSDFLEENREENEENKNESEENKGAYEESKDARDEEDAVKHPTKNSNLLPQNIGSVTQITTSQFAIEEPTTTVSYSEEKYEKETSIGKIEENAEVNTKIKVLETYKKRIAEIILPEILKTVSEMFPSLIHNSSQFNTSLSDEDDRLNDEKINLEYTDQMTQIDDLQEHLATDSVTPQYFAKESVKYPLQLNLNSNLQQEEERARLKLDGMKEDKRKYNYHNYTDLSPQNISKENKDDLTQLLTVTEKDIRFDIPSTDTENRKESLSSNKSHILEQINLKSKSRKPETGVKLLSSQIAQILYDLLVNSTFGHLDQETLPVTTLTLSENPKDISIISLLVDSATGLSEKENAIKYIKEELRKTMHPTLLEANFYSIPLAKKVQMVDSGKRKVQESPVRNRTNIRKATLQSIITHPVKQLQEPTYEIVGKGRLENKEIITYKNTDVSPTSELRKTLPIRKWSEIIETKASASQSGTKSKISEKSSSSFQLRNVNNDAAPSNKLHSNKKTETKVILDDSQDTEQELAGAALISKPSLKKSEMKAEDHKNVDEQDFETSVETKQYILVTRKLDNKIPPFQESVALIKDIPVDKWEADVVKIRKPLRPLIPSNIVKKTVSSLSNLSDEIPEANVENGTVLETSNESLVEEQNKLKNAESDSILKSNLDQISLITESLIDRSEKSPEIKINSDHDLQLPEIPFINGTQWNNKTSEESQLNNQIPQYKTNDSAEFKEVGTKAKSRPVIQIPRKVFNKIVPNETYLRNKPVELKPLRVYNITAQDDLNTTVNKKQLTTEIKTISQSPLRPPFRYFKSKESNSSSFSIKSKKRKQPNNKLTDRTNSSSRPFRYRMRNEIKKSTEKTQEILRKILDEIHVEKNNVSSIVHLKLLSIVNNNTNTKSNKNSGTINQENITETVGPFNNSTESAKVERGISEAEFQISEKLLTPNLKEDWVDLTPINQNPKNKSISSSFDNANKVTVNITELVNSTKSENSNLDKFSNTEISQSSVSSISHSHEIGNVTKNTFAEEQVSTVTTKVIYMEILGADLFARPIANATVEPAKESSVAVELPSDEKINTKTHTIREVFERFKWKCD